MSKILKSVHGSMKDLHDIGLIDEVTMRDFDARCLPPVPEYSSTQVVKIRRKTKASQGVFAAFLNVGKSTVAAWEQGTKKPSGPAARLLDIVDRKGLDAIA
ncbi:MAG TPA: DNA-binding transcriptional regulator [Ferrovibrio sp.]|uniref:helix-turn-helix domain-containing protein n=1 Tax=Ferrovibrio sp. TaxID=1917215 RepID=UPI002ED17E17